MGSTTKRLCFRADTELYRMQFEKQLRLQLQYHSHAIKNVIQATMLRQQIFVPTAGRSSQQAKAPGQMWKRSW